MNRIHGPVARLAFVVALALALSGCTGTFSVGVAIPGPYAGPYGGSMYVGGSVPFHW